MYEDFMLEDVEEIKEFISSKIAVGYLFNSVYGECLDGSVIKCQTFTIDEFQTWSKLIDALLKENWSLLRVTMTRGES